MTYNIPEIKVTTVKLHERPTKSADSPEAFATLWREMITKADWYDSEKEHVVVVALDTKLKVKCFFMVSVGTLNESYAGPREIFRPLIAAAAHSFVLMHNHPSGDPSPSDADRRVTRRTKEAGELIGIKIIDHVIVGESQHFSFREHGMI
jgi:DNA repair protein RadC